MRRPKLLHIHHSSFRIHHFSERALKLDGAGEEDVVFEVYVSVKVLLELFERVVERAEAGAGIFGRVEVEGGGAKPAQDVARRVVLEHHHADGVADGAEGREWRRRLSRGGFFETEDVGEENLLLLEEVRLEVCVQTLEERGDFAQLRVVIAVLRADLLK